MTLQSMPAETNDWPSGSQQSAETEYSCFVSVCRHAPVCRVSGQSTSAKTHLDLPDLDRIVGGREQDAIVGTPRERGDAVDVAGQELARAEVAAAVRDGPEDDGAILGRGGEVGAGVAERERPDLVLMLREDVRARGREGVARALVIDEKRRRTGIGRVVEASYPLMVLGLLQERLEAIGRQHDTGRNKCCLISPA